jgi:ADP-dependent NAD(P)H-hydrate dehydratase
MTPIEINASLVSASPLPLPHEGSKDDRGRVLVVAGSAGVPGAALLAGTAALRAGAGKLQLATVKCAAISLAIAVPEALVIGLPETVDGAIAYEGTMERLTSSLEGVDAVLVGPGMAETEDTITLTEALMARAGPSTCFVADATALCGYRSYAEVVRSRKKWTVITPHAGEMAGLLNRSRESVEADPGRAAEDAAELLNAVVVMKGPQTLIVTPDQQCWLYTGGGVGLATSGSGDVLAGLIAGLLARGVDPTHAAIWGVYLHGEAGRSLSAKVGTLGFLARDLAAEATAVMGVVA